jgi:TPP-dependent pyruvate/acetoin dehydrogenase alpha subunit
MTTRKKKPSAVAGNDGFSLISNEKLIALYAAMLRCHMLDARIRSLAGPARTAFGRGHEAAVAAATIDLLPADAISPPRGGLAPCLVKGVRLRTIFAWLRTQPDALPVRYAPRGILAPGANSAAQFKAAHRAAQRVRAAKKKNLVVVFSDCASLTRGDGLGFLRAAAAERLPILFVCHARSSKEDFAPMARNYGLPGITVDGDDVVAIYRVVCEAITHARRGNGPTLIECKPWMVTGAKRRAAGNAIPNMEAYLSRKGLFSARLKAGMTAQFMRELDKAAHF